MAIIILLYLFPSKDEYKLKLADCLEWFNLKTPMTRFLQDNI